MKRRRTTKTSDAEEPMDTTEDKTPVTLSSERFHITSPYWLTKVSSNSEIRISCVSNSSLKRRGLMSRYYGRKFFFISTIFLDRDGHLHCRTMEKRMGYRFVSVCNLARESHTWQLSFYFFLPYLQEQGCWDPGISLPWQRDVTTSPFSMASCSKNALFLNPGFVTVIVWDEVSLSVLQH